MIDLTPLDVRKKRGDFRRILRGYDPEEVDTFMDLVAERFEELVRENLSLGEKTERIGRQLESLEGRERAIQEALVTAQKLRKEVGDQSRRDAEVLQEQASRMAELLKAEADTEIQRRLGEAEGLIHERQRALEDLERSRLKFLKSFRGLLEREMDAVDVEESRRPLEETPLELDFRGWMPTGDLGFGIGEGEFEEGEAEAEAEEIEEIEAPAEFPAVVLDEEDGSEDLQTGFETQILEGAAPATLDPGTEAEEEAGAEETAEAEEAAEAEETAGAEEAAETEDDPEDLPREPRWLFSLLQKDEEKGEEA